MGAITLALYEVCQIEKDNGNGLRIGLDDYPIFDKAYRNPLNEKIIRHFWNRDIGLETISQFSFNLRRKMWEIMPLYNQVYESTKIEFDPLATFDLQTIRNDKSTETGTADTENSSKVDSSADARTVNSEFPQGQLSRSGDYATNASDSDSKSASETETTGNVKNSSNSELDGESRTTGFQGAASDLLMRYRASLLNVDMMVIGELSELFMGVWGTGDELLPPNYNYSGGFYDYGY